MRRCSSSGVSSSGVAPPMPALLTSTSTAPCSDTVSKARLTDAVDVTSSSITSIGRAASAAAVRRGPALPRCRMEAHILAITQAICDHRRRLGITGPLFVGKDTHAVSGPAEHTALEVLAANGVETVLQRDDGVTPTPAISRAILVHNRARRDHLAD